MDPYNDYKQIYVYIDFPNETLKIPAEIRYGDHPNKGGYDICLKLLERHSEIKPYDDKYEIESFDSSKVVMPFQFHSSRYGGESSSILRYTLRN